MRSLGGKRDARPPLVSPTLWLLGLSLLPILSSQGLSQAVAERRLENGLWQLESQHLTLVTDIVPDAEIRAMPTLFEHALLAWTQFLPPPGEITDKVQVTAYLMADRQRFVELNLLDPDDNFFRHGYQFENRIFLSEQPSAYYRRHLFLHEGTHWFLWRFFSGNGPPWFSEGLCEWLGTHRWNGQDLTLGIMPLTADEVPYWGRLRMIRDDLKQHQAPDLTEIMRYTTTAHRVDNPYAWSWAAVYFFANHPRYRGNFQRLIQAPLEDSPATTQRFKEQLVDDWPVVFREWKLFIDELDYGYAAAAFTDLGSSPSPPQRPVKLDIQADRGWQSTGILCLPQQKIAIQASGEVSVRAARPAEREPEWLSQPQGLTLEYYRQHPLGSLVATVVPWPGQPGKPIKMHDSWERWCVGQENHWTSTDGGWLLLRVNEAPGGLHDNAGSYQVIIEPR
jgi:hypothetical protein